MHSNAVGARRTLRSVCCEANAPDFWSFWGLFLFCIASLGYVVSAILAPLELQHRTPCLHDNTTPCRSAWINVVCALVFVLDSAVYLVLWYRFERHAAIAAPPTAAAAISASTTAGASSPALQSEIAKPATPPSAPLLPPPLPPLPESTALIDTLEKPAPPLATPPPTASLWHALVARLRAAQALDLRFWSVALFAIASYYGMLSALFYVLNRADPSVPQCALRSAFWYLVDAVVFLLMWRRDAARAYDVNFAAHVVFIGSSACNVIVALADSWAPPGPLAAATLPTLNLIGSVLFFVDACLYSAAFARVPFKASESGERRE